MSPFQTADNDSIDTQAAHWFSRNRNDRSHASRDLFNTWLADPAHAQAYAEFEALWTELGELEALNAPLALPVRKRRRTGLALATAAAVLCAVFAMNIGAPVTLQQQQIVTREQGARTVVLDDGSRLTVNANTRVRVDFSAHQRTLYLDQGQLYIEVAANKEQPLVVQAGAARIRVVGTGFDVRRSQRQLVVSVAHGQVAFMPDPKTSTLLTARQRATYSYANASLQAQTLGAGEVADWRSGRLAFRNRELASLIDELSLYRPQTSLQVSKAVAQLKVSGNLDVNDPDALLKALPALLPVKTVLSADGTIRIEPSK